MTPMPGPRQAFEQASTPSAFPQTTAPPEAPANLGGGIPKTAAIQQPLRYAAGRRTHKKSRTGCSTCKTRKIKCDERHPACLNCISHGVECPFLKSGPAASPAPAARQAASKPKSPSSVSLASASAPTPAPTPALMMLPEGEELPLLELELLHNFTTKTYTTLTADPCLWDFWRGDVVQLGLRCDYIMRAVLAVSALHLAYHRPDRRDFYSAQSILLHRKASHSAMRAMAAGTDMDIDTATNLFLFSMLTMFFALASPRRSNPDGTFFIGDSGFPDWAFLLGGGKSIMQVLGWERRLETAAAPFLVYGDSRWRAHRAKLEELQRQHEQQQQQSNRNQPSPGSYPSPSSSTTSAATTATTATPGFSPSPPATLLLAPLRARITSTVTDPALLATYTHAVDELELALVVVRQDSDRDPGAPRDVLDAMVWLWEVSDSLVPLLRPDPAPRQEAVAIFAHFCVLLKHHESHWWLQGWADHLMARAREVLDEEHSRWIEWPLRELGLMRDGAHGQGLQGGMGQGPDLELEGGLS
ncbi:hypothetical protein VTK26DRAFT_965 [Humicola hyalothermophila]